MAKLKDTTILGNLIVTGKLTGTTIAQSTDAETLNGLPSTSFVRSDASTNFNYNILQNGLFQNWSETRNDLGSISGSVTLSTLLGNVITASLTANTTFIFTSPANTGVSLGFTLVLSNSGTSTITWPSSVKWSGGVVPTLSATGIDVFSFTTVNDGTTWLGMMSGKGFA